MGMQEEEAMATVKELERRITDLGAEVRLLEALIWKFEPPELMKCWRVLENMERSVKEFGFSVRVDNCLEAANVKTVRELVQKTEQDLLGLKNFGRKSLGEVKEVLAGTGTGLSLGMTFDSNGLPVWPD